MYGSISNEDPAEVLQVSLTYEELYSDKEVTTEKYINLKTLCPFCNSGTCSSPDKVPLHACNKCKGNQFIEDIKKVPFYIPPGAKDGDKITTKDANKNTTFVIKEIPHQFFNRGNDDLFLNLRITLNEALNGFRIPVVLPDKHTIVIHSPIDRVIQHKSIYFVPDVGFPAGASTKRGSLYIRFFVDMPTAKVYKTMAEKLVHVLPMDRIDCSDAQEVALEDM